ncbi:MAG: hypothetical protein IJ774_04395 [Selenomonadaceae bacterium]|nr:hypothetical protein [Selenomonadaceae bacterium]
MSEQRYLIRREVVNRREISSRQVVNRREISTRTSRQPPSKIRRGQVVNSRERHPNNDI